MRRVSIVVVTLILVVVGLLGFGVLHGYWRRPVVSAGPPDPLPALRTWPHSVAACSARIDDWGEGAYALFEVGVGADPVAVDAVWWPTLDDQACELVETFGDQAEARALAAAVDTAPAIPRGVFSCPDAVGGAVDLYFSYKLGAYGKSKWERVRVDPTGCGEVFAAGRKARRWLGFTALSPLVPPGEWARILR